MKNKHIKININILCSIHRPIPIWVIKVWRRNLNYAKNLQAKYFTGENIPIYSTCSYHFECTMTEMPKTVQWTVCTNPHQEKLPLPHTNTITCSDVYNSSCSNSMVDKLHIHSPFTLLLGHANKVIPCTCMWLNSHRSCQSIPEPCEHCHGRPCYQQRAR